MIIRLINKFKKEKEKPKRRCCECRYYGHILQWYTEDIIWCKMYKVDLSEKLKAHANECPYYEER